MAQPNPGDGASAPEASKIPVQTATEEFGSNAAAPRSQRFRLDLEDALTPDPGTEDMYKVENNKFAYAPGQLSKLLNPKSLPAFYALGGLNGLEKGLRTDRTAGLSVDEQTLDGQVSFKDVAPDGVAPDGRGMSAAVAKEAREDGSAEKGDDGKKGKKKDKKKKEKVDPTKPPPAPKITSGPFADRLSTYRDNRLPEKKSKSLLQLAWSTYNDKVLILLTVAAVVSLALGLYQTFGQKHEAGEAKVEWVEGVAIMVAIVIVVVVGTVNDWQMERQFVRLNKKNDDRKVKVIRSGKSVELSVYDVLVGDVMHLTPGDMVPVDGIFITGHGVKCDESSATGESDLLRKTPGDEVFEALQRQDRDDLQKLDPFIISGSKVSEGTGTFLVTAVGVNSAHGRTSMALREEQEATPLQKKLNVLADYIAKIGGSAALVLFIVLFIKFLAQLKGNSDTPDQKAQNFLHIFIVSVTVVVVAVPEGLPLAVTLALAFATTRMLKDNNLVRVLRACETMGNATTICSDKTGTLTENKMTVVASTIGKRASFGGQDVVEEKADSPVESDKVPNVTVDEFVSELDAPTKSMLVQGIAVNSTAFEGEQDGKQTFIGSKTETALLEFSRDRLGAGPVAEERSNANTVQVVPFDSAVKYMASVVKLRDGKYRAYVKGASEILLRKCTKILASNAPDSSTTDFATTPLTDTDRKVFEGVITTYASQSLRTIGVSYKDFESWPPAEAISSDDSRQGDFDAVHENMTLVGIFGIKDPLRQGVEKAVEDCQNAGVFVRMVTGDNILTARAIARECGIYTPDTGGVAMEGPEFRRLPEHERKEVVPRLQVLARSSPEDKRILVRTLKELGETVAVTGDGTNDAPALKTADIGFSMGIAGTEVAKEASAIVLMDDNFASIVKGIMWGRAVNDSVKKFLQFQITVNITAVVLTFVSAVASESEESVLNAVQLLWVNLIMDTFAALALATDPPSHNILDRKPDRKSAPLITLRMAKMIIGQAIYQLIITLLWNFAGKNIMGYSNSEEDTTLLKTLVFNSFVWMQIFNEVNNRRLDNKLNIFEGIHRNWFFLIINILMIGGQALIIIVGGQAFRITPGPPGLPGKEWGVSIALGFGSIPVGVLVRLVPDRWVAALLPFSVRRAWAPETIPARMLAERGDHESFADSKQLSFIRSVRGGRVNTFSDRVLSRRERAIIKVEAKIEHAMDKMHVHNGSGSGGSRGKASRGENLV